MDAGVLTFPRSTQNGVRIDFDFWQRRLHIGNHISNCRGVSSRQPDRLFADFSHSVSPKGLSRTLPFLANEHPLPNLHRAVHSLALQASRNDHRLGGTSPIQNWGDKTDMVMERTPPKPSIGPCLLLLKITFLSQALLKARPLVQ